MTTTPSVVDVGLLHFGVESFAQVIDDIRPLLERHWAEIAVHSDIPLDPDYNFYLRASESGQAVIYTAREGGALVGYAIYFVRPHHHYRGALWAVSDIIWIAPEKRRAGVATFLFDFIDADLRRRGVAVVHTIGKTGHRALAAFLEDRDQTCVEFGYSHRLR